MVAQRTLTGRLHRPSSGAAALLLLLVATVGSPLFARTSDSTNVRINDPSQDRLPNCSTQNGATLARSATTLVAGWNDGRQCDLLIQRSAEQLVNGVTGGGIPATTGISLSGYGWSDDGGVTWHDGGELPPPAGGNVFGDPVLSAGPDGAFYYATLIGTPRCCRVGVYRSADGGRTWSGPVEVGTDRPGELHDKPWIGVDTSDSPHRGTIYVTWTHFENVEGFWEARTVLAARSTDGGRTFGPSHKLSVPATVGNLRQEFPGTATQVAVGPDGQVYVVWTELTRLWFTRSDDGGRTFSVPRFIVMLEPPGRPRACFPLGRIDYVLNGDIRVGHWPSLAVDTTGTSDPEAHDFNPHRGRIYLAVAHRRNAWHPLRPLAEGTLDDDDSDVVLVSSHDGGDSWTNVSDKPWNPLPLQVLNDDGTHTDQFHPQVAVAADGAVAVSWYDRRLSEGLEPDPAVEPNWLIDVFAAVSTDGGQTFAPSFRLTDRSFPPARVNPHANWLAGCYMGDYNAMLGGGRGEFLLAWGDNRDGTPALPDPNVYFDRIVVKP